MQFYSLRIQPYVQRCPSVEIPTLCQDSINRSVHCLLENGKAALTSLININIFFYTNYVPNNYKHHKPSKCSHLEVMRLNTFGNRFVNYIENVKVNITMHYASNIQVILLARVYLLRACQRSQETLQIHEKCNTTRSNEK